MRIRRNSIVLGCFLGGVALMGSGCLDALGDFYLPLTDPALATWGSSGSTSSSSSTGAGGTPAACVPSASKDPVADSCGVFVSSSLGADDAAADRGTQAKPFKSIGAALMKADVTRVYACAESFTEAVTLSAAVELYGGLDCKSWAYVGATKKTTLTALADAVPMTVGNAAGSMSVEDFAVASAAAKVSGGSSIAVLANGATVSFARCDLTASDAKDGDLGVSGGAQEAQTEAGKVGGDAGTVGVGSVTGGAAGQNNSCSLAGGKGGDGGAIGSGDGGDGFQGDGNMGGAKGTGQTSMAACTNGANGDLGIAGPLVSGGQGIGGINASGYQGTDGDTGQDGSNGKSGGGGGGSKAGVTVHGAGGGGGGAGGCAGKHGMGGKGGGSSIALVSIGATVTLSECKLTTGKGGKGGAGGDGQFGQPGGVAGLSGTGNMGVIDGCNGGKGGSGGNGGNGGGGLGGHSLGIAVKGSAPALDTLTQKAITLGGQGPGGLGGNMDADMNHGAPGMASTCWDFSKNASCTQ